MNKLSLYEQLLYNWERGFYSVVKDGDRYGIFSTKDKEGKLRYCYANSIDVAKTLIGEYQSTQFGYPDEEEISMMRFRGTIHPSELMGKGFQVGDKVRTKHQGEDLVGEVVETQSTTDRYMSSCKVQFSGFYAWKTTEELKPVLPVEEKKEEAKILGCKIIADERIPKGAMVMFDNEGKAIAMFKEGKIINLS